MTVVLSEDYERVSCYRCGIVFYAPAAWDQGKRNDHSDLWCPNGHVLAYSHETKAEKLERENQRLKQNQAYLEDRRREAEEAAEHERKVAQGYKGSMRKLQKRASAGVCPCCQRSFVHLRRHMKTKHPHFVEDHQKVAAE